MRDRREHGTELLAAQAEDGTHAACHTKEHTSNTRVDTNRSEGDDGNSDDGIRGILGIVTEHRSRVDVQVRNQGRTDHDQGRDDLAEEDVGDASARHISRALLRRNTQKLFLVSSDSGPRETTETDP